ncbi:MAG: arsenic efflux protein [Clostridiales bacterium]|uniref:putative manganese transporter n=1 Tax=Clostridium sp. N3C TaxID=1776758 RepID=UPI00092E0E94|nr:putative manganese transporter [Clostridium sp. N3C]NLZ49730.1 arsenic efflux protein [Clostridiales bacterium]SCN25252.1 putative permease [Clostridium sp. N3C]
MSEILLDALIDTAKMIPFLFVIYVAIEYIEIKLGDNLITKVKKAGKVAPAAGALFGLVPQCGFSVMATALYNKKVVTLGTLLAVYLSTSDEALPIILSQPDKIRVVLPLFLSKFIIALVAGYLVDFIITTRAKRQVGAEICASSEVVEDNHLNEIHEKGCCGHSCSSNEVNWKELITHPIKHTITIFIYLFIASVIINSIISYVGEDNLGNVLMSNSLFQPIFASIFGLIPNCASSVAITEVFLKGGLSFGSVIAGLGSNAGLGLLVLFKENKSVKDSLRVVALLVAISSVAGIIIELFIRLMS